MYVYDVEARTVAKIIGVSSRSITRWYCLFKRNGNVRNTKKVSKESRWSLEVKAFAQQYIEVHPTFYIEELQHAVKSKFPNLSNTSQSTI
jgi:transposase